MFAAFLLRGNIALKRKNELTLFFVKGGLKQIKNKTCDILETCKGIELSKHGFGIALLIGLNNV